MTLDHAPWQDPEERSILLIAYVDDWHEARDAGRYTVSTKGRTLAEVGFIHASFNRDQIRRVGAYHYAAEERDLVVLVIATETVEAPVVAENLEGGDELFAHVYGSIPTQSVVATVPVRTAGQRFEALWDRKAST